MKNQVTKIDVREFSEIFIRLDLKDGASGYHNLSVEVERKGCFDELTIAAACLDVAQISEIKLKLPSRATFLRIKTDSNAEDVIVDWEAEEYHLRQKNFGKK